MRIDTDKIKNKKFTEPIKSEPLKHSQEYRVLATLRYLYPNRFENMVTGESPDLQDNENGVGIEVTAAVDFRDMRASREFVNLQQKNGNTEKHKRAIVSSGYSILPISIKEDMVAISSSGTSDGEKSFFKRAYEERKKRLSSTSQILRGWGSPYFCLKFQPLTQKTIFLNGFLKLLTSLQSCLILCM